MRTEPTNAPIPPDGGARRRRPLLVSLSAFGAVIGLLGGVGVFANAFDRSTTGPNSIETGDYDDPDADLQIAEYDEAAGTCGPFSDDLATGLHSIGVGDPTFQGTRICLRNVGELDGYVSMSILDATDIELACSPDEPAVDDTCGGAGEGELSELVEIVAGDPVGEACGSVANPVSSRADDLTTTPLALFPLAAGETVDALCIAASWGGQPLDMQRAQTDRFTWRYAFDIGPDAPGCQDDAGEPDSTFTDARALDGSNHGSGVICGADQDVFAYQHPGGNLTASLGFDPTAGDLDLVLYDANGTVVGSSASSDSTEQATVSNAAAGAYYVVVRGYADPTGTYPNERNTYDLQVSSGSVIIGPPPGGEQIS